MTTLSTVDTALDRAINLGVNVRVTAHEVLDYVERENEPCEIGSHNGRPWHIGITRDYSTGHAPTVVYLEQLGRGGYAETFELA